MSRDETPLKVEPRRKPARTPLIVKITLAAMACGAILFMARVISRVSAVLSAQEKARLEQEERNRQAATQPFRDAADILKGPFEIVPEPPAADGSVSIKVKRTTPKPVDPALDVPSDACDEAKNDHELVGKWEVVLSENSGEKFTGPAVYEFTGGRWLMTEGDFHFERTIELDRRSNPKRLDSRQMVSSGTIVLRAIYRLDGDTLTICGNQRFLPRPEKFIDRTTAENSLSLIVLRRLR
jgi:uncharacterized protein (TIGR03067 family)